MTGRYMGQEPGVKRQGLEGLFAVEGGWGRAAVNTHLSSLMLGWCRICLQRLGIRLDLRVGCDEMPCPHCEEFIEII